MLERTAAGLESCSLQRVVVSKPAKRCRQLHTGFWQHGASAIDLSSFWPGPSRAYESETVEADSAVRQLQSGLIASAFLLDFLYPSATLPILRRIYPSLPRSQDGQQTADVSAKRTFYTKSSAQNFESLDCPSVRSIDTAEFYHHRPEGRELPITSVRQTYGVSQNARERTARNRAETASITNDSHETTVSNTSTVDAEVGGLQELLDDPEGASYQQVWDLYCRVDPQQRANMQADVVKYLAKSHGFVETGRAMSIFRQIPVSSWDNSLLSAGVLLFLRSGDLSYAADRFKTGLEAKNLSGGLEYLLADAISSRQWTIALDVWCAYYAAQVKSRPNAQPDMRQLQELNTLPNHGALYFAFRSYLVSDGAEYYKKIKESPVSNAAFRIFRRHFAKMALWEPCSPERAAVILESLNDQLLYNGYLFRMFDRWYEKHETKSTIAKLPVIYEKFRELPDAKPTRAVLRGLFKLYWPNNSAGLDQVYKDWLQFHGELGQWGYEKFLKLYAHRGDVKTVRDLWAKYVAEFPEILKTPRAFRSTLNVYAQTGDLAEAERELREMSTKYGVEPDVDCWNTILKCYTRVNDYRGALKCFDEICKRYTPDSFTYAHVMAMAAKKGDLETTLDFFRRSQEARTPLTKEMALALVVAYCQNDLLLEAERLCIELSERRLAHTALWNQLLRSNGAEGKLSKCYDLLQRMKHFGMEWNDDTYEFFLQALVKANQIHPAYTLLKQADEDGLFKATAEHFAIVMAGAARTGDFTLVDKLKQRLQKLNLPMTFNALIAVVEAAVRRKPGVERTQNLSHEFVAFFREAVAAQNSTPTMKETTEGSLHVTPQAIWRLQADPQAMGRAITLLVELRDFSTAEELMTLYTELFPQFKKGNEFPPSVVSALMLAHYRTGNLDEVLELWTKTWQRVLESSRNRKGTGISPSNEYDLCRVLNVVIRAFADRNDAQGLSDCVDEVIRAGFKLTRSNWALVVTSLVDLGRWEQAMYWCEKMLMPGWRGWRRHRLSKERSGLTNTRLLRAPKYVVLKLQPQWLKMRQMAAWSPDISRQLREVQERYPRLHHAFTTNEMQNLPPWLLNENHVQLRDLDKLVRSLPYNELIKVRDVLLKQLMQERKREKRLGLAAAPQGKTDAERLNWKRALHGKVQRYAQKWAERREARPQGTSAVETQLEPAPSSGVEERTGYWQDFWERYDQTPHMTAKKRSKKG